MAQGDKSAYYQALKKAGYEFDRHYRDYTTQDLIEICEQIEETTGETVEVAPSAPHEQMPPRDSEMAEMREQFDRLTELVGDLADLVTANVKPSPKPAPDPSEQFAVTSTEHAGLTQNVAGKDGVQFVDEYGNEWYQPEVTKPSYAKSRGRRVLRTMGGATRQETIATADGMTESFEVFDNASQKPLEVKITLPSHQTGIYKDPKMPFKIHTYRGARGFNFFDVQNFYGGADLVPSSIKRIYVGQDLCYDITTTIRTIEAEYVQRVLKKETL